MRRAILILLLLAGCSSLGTKDEFMALSCDERTALLYDYARENRAWAIGGTVLGAAGAASGTAALIGTIKTGAGLTKLGAAVSAGHP